MMQKHMALLIPWILVPGISIAEASEYPPDARESATVNAVTDTENTTVSGQHDTQYPARRGYGLGYSYNDINRHGYRSRSYGYGYGRGRRGYGYGYPGYRSQGGSPYPRHRQYGNPPFYSSHSTEDDQPATQD